MTCRLSRQRWQTCENARSSLLGSPLFCTKERCADLRIVVVHEGQYFLKNSTRHRVSDMRIKIACIGIRLSVITVDTTVVTTIACRRYSRDDCINDSSYRKSYADACDFFSYVRCAMLGNDFLKKSCAFCPLGCGYKKSWGLYGINLDDDWYVQAVAGTIFGCSGTHFWIKFETNGLSYRIGDFIIVFLVQFS